MLVLELCCFWVMFVILVQKCIALIEIIGFALNLCCFSHKMLFVWEMFKFDAKRCFQANIMEKVCSQAVTHPSTNHAQRCLTSVIGRELVCSTWYGRWREKGQGEGLLRGWVRTKHSYNSLLNQNEGLRAQVTKRAPKGPDEEVMRRSFGCVCGHRQWDYCRLLPPPPPPISRQCSGVSLLKATATEKFGAFSF